MRSVFSIWAVCSADCWSVCWTRWSLAWSTETGWPLLSKNWRVASDLSKKSESSLHKRRSLRNCQRGVNSLTWCMRQVTMWIYRYVVNTSAWTIIRLWSSPFLFLGDSLWTLKVEQFSMQCLTLPSNVISLVECVGVGSFCPVIGPGNSRHPQDKSDVNWDWN